MMIKVHFLVFLSFCLSACQPQLQTAVSPATVLPPTQVAQNKGMKLSSPDFEDGKKIPDKYACRSDQPGKSPELLIQNVPGKATSLALIVEDPDAPTGIFEHWVLYNIPPGLPDIPESMPVRDHVAGIGNQGKNSFGAIGYGGPCPPFGQTHRYFFHLFALDLGLSTPTGLDASQLKAKIQGHILAQTDLVGLYK